jgi:uncharacterized protein YndB with AHSA1/START domain
MTERSTQHATFVIERAYDASPARVFAAWADKAAKARWFGGPDGLGGYELDFRVGGREVNRGGPSGGPVYTYDACYADIVPNQRIVYTYTMDCGDARISVSVTTVEFKAAGAGTQLTFTEQGVFLEGADTPQMREHGTKELLDSLGAALSGTPATA